MKKKLKLTRLKREICATLLIFSVGISAIALAENQTIQLTPQEQTDLEQGKVILKGEKGDYYGQVLVKGKTEIAWQVLTDYGSFKNFLPNIADSKLIKEEGITKIFEQTNIVDLWLVTKKFIVQIAARENQPQQIDFQMVKGDLARLEGKWHLQALPNNQVLVTHQVKVAPKEKSEEAIFYGIYESSLEDTLAAIATEITKRSD
jgi:ribosome-associated toxin RatA of RatAB toxin-antitoxin module